MDRPLADLPVRAILLAHATSLRKANDPRAGREGPASSLSPAGANAVPQAPDPNRLAAAAELSLLLDEMARDDGPGAVRAAGRSYVSLWARTFRTLVAQLRGRPERALNLFAQEIYPFLRGDRLAARLEPTHAAGDRAAHLVLAGGLPDEYCCGLVEGMLALSGCRASCRALGNGHFEATYSVPPQQRLARLVQAAATLRLPLLVAALLAAAVGAAAAWPVSALAFWRFPAALLAVVAVQAAANAWHDLASPSAAGPLSPWRPSRAALRAQAMAGYAVAAAIGVLLVPATPEVLLFVPAGLAASLLYHKVRDHGFGPILVAATHGPLIALGVLAALVVHPTFHTQLVTVAASLPVGALAAAVRTLDDLADRPLDEAGGRRTLAVRLPGPQNAILYGALVAAGLATLAGLAFAQSGPRIAYAAALLAPLALAAALAWRRVQGHLDDPHELAGARAATIGLHVACAALAVAILGGVA